MTALINRKINYLLFIIPTLSFVLCYSETSFAQTDILSSFIGNWKGSGKLFGRPAEFTMSWEYALKGRFIRLSFRNPAIAAEAFYTGSDSGRYKGTWADSRGVVQPLKSSIQDSVFKTFWGSETTEQGRTEYRLLTADKIEVQDFVLRNGKWAQFGSALYKKQSSLLDNMTWLLGSWQRESKNSITHETWRKLSAQTFEGESVRITKATGDTAFTESLRLLEMEGEVFYLPKVAENDLPIPFKRLSSSENKFIFHNSAHDFPKQIIYKPISVDSLIVTISGKTKQGERSIDFQFKRH